MPATSRKALHPVRAFNTYAEGFLSMPFFEIVGEVLNSTRDSTPEIRA